MSATSAMDGYTFKARYLPAFITVLPAWLAFAVWFPPDKAFQGVFASAGVTVVLGAILAQIGRDAGRQRQTSLFREWGGSPSVQALSFRQKMVNAATLTRCHVALNSLAPELELPVSGDEESVRWPEVIARYESAADLLREATRDKARFRLVYAENVNYGFRRNLWAMKAGGIALALAGIVLTLVHASRVYLENGSLHGLDAASLLFSLTLLGLWMVRFTKAWVRIAADAYAIQLVASAETIAKESAK